MKYFNTDVDSELYNQKAKVFNKMKNYDEAIKCLERAIELNPGDHELYYNKGLYYFYKGDYNNAIIFCDHTIELNSSYEIGYLLKAQALNMINRYSEAIAVIEKALALLKLRLSERFYYQKGLALKGLGRHVEAIKEYKNALNCKPGDSACYFAIGVVYLNLSLLENALKYFIRAVECDPGLCEPYVNISYIYNMLGKYEESVRYADMAIGIDAENIKANAIKARSLYMLGKYDEAEAECNNSLKNDPDNGSLFYTKALVLHKKGLYLQALYTIERIKELGNFDDEMAKVEKEALKNLQSGKQRPQRKNAFKLLKS